MNCYPLDIQLQKPETKSTISIGQTPRVKWAQNTNLIFLTICVMDCDTPKIHLQPQSLHFEGLSGSNQTRYDIRMDFLNDIDPEKSKYLLRDRGVEFILLKRNPGPFWNRLLKVEDKQHWLMIDFDKWKDESDSEDEEEEKLTEEEENERRYGRPPLDFKSHISDNISKGSCLCPLGSSIMGKAMKMEQGLNELSKNENGKQEFDLHGFDENAPDSDDELLSDLEES